MSNIRFISDLHFGHTGIIAFSGTERGGVTSIEEHDKWIVEQWNSVVSKNDLVWVLGDVCMDKTKLPLLKKMKGNKHLILGNHDEFTLDVYAPYFNKIHGFLKYKGFWISHAPLHPHELRGKVNLHGHLHKNIITRWNPEKNDWEPDPNYICVSVEQVNGCPISMIDIKKRSENK